MQKEAMLKIFKMSGITQYNALEFLDIYEIKIEEYSGKQIYRASFQNYMERGSSKFLSF